jgi:fucose 4-O-acetylase-like acetyltransferase
MTTILAKKSNKQFMILSAIGILFVVDAHAWSPLAIMGYFFPYNSFFIPMFCFISGYFFKYSKLEHMPSYFLHKVKTLLLPFFIWNTVYGILINVLHYYGVISYGSPLSVSTLVIRPFLDCLMFDINSPSWFLPALFLVIILYALIRKILNPFWNEYIASILFILIGTYCVYLSRRGYNQNSFYLPILKTFFLLQFYQIGVFFNRHIEPLYSKAPKLLLLSIPVIINTLISYKVGFVTFNFTDITTMSGFRTDYYFLPLITSITGICFWLTIANILTPALGNHRLVNYISDNTLTIMLHHIFFFNVYNLILAILTALNILHIPFNFDAFRSTAWYRFDIVITCNIMYVFFGMFGPIITKYLFTKLKNVLPLNNKKKEVITQPL